MKIACVGKSFQIAEVGGLLTSSLAFHKWSNIFGIEVDQVGFTYTGRVPKSWKFPGYEDKLKVFKESDYYDVLNSYDAIYFVYIAVKTSKKNPPNYFETKGINVPFFVGIHDEDYNLLYVDYLNEAAKNPNFRGFTNPSYKIASFLPESAPQHYWYPSTLPEYLLQESTQWDNNPQGLLHFGRLIYWSRLPVLAKLSHESEFMTEVQNRIEVKGNFFGIGGFSLKLKLESLNPNWDITPNSSISVFDVDLMKEMYSSFRFFWTVGRMTEGVEYLKRLNLVSIEAAGQGCIPIISPQFAPEWTYKFGILFDDDRLKSGEFLSNLKSVNENLESHRQIMKDTILNSEWSYERVKERTKIMIDKLF